jgi:hypothetical protein
MTMSGGASTVENCRPEPHGYRVEARPIQGEPEHHTDGDNLIEFTGATGTTFPLSASAKPENDPRFPTPAPRPQ